MSLPSWELLSYIVTVVALPFAIAVFLFEQRKERANEEEAIWQRVQAAHQSRALPGGVLKRWQKHCHPDASTL